MFAKTQTYSKDSPQKNEVIHVPRQREVIRKKKKYSMAAWVHNNNCLCPIVVILRGIVHRMACVCASRHQINNIFYSVVCLPPFIISIRGHRFLCLYDTVMSYHTYSFNFGSFTYACSYFKRVCSYNSWLNTTDVTNIKKIYI